MTTLPGQQAAQLQGLDQQKTNAFNGIQNTANNSGMFYSGAPISEEQRYTGGTYMPAVANLQAQTNQQKYGLQSALANVGVQQTGQASNLYQTQLGQDQQQRQFDQQMQMQQLQNQSMRDIYSRGSSSGGQAAAAPTWNQTLGSAFNNYDPTKQGRQANFTEQQIAPKLASAMNVPYAQALQQAYQYRKQVYHQ